MEKNRVLNHSITQAPSLFSAPGTEAFASDNLSFEFASHCKRQRSTVSICDAYIPLFSAVCGHLYVCLDVNQGGTNRSRCTQRLIILHAQTY